MWSIATLSSYCHCIHTFVCYGNFLYMKSLKEQPIYLGYCESRPHFLNMIDKIKDTVMDKCPDRSLYIIVEDEVDKNAFSVKQESNFSYLLLNYSEIASAVGENPEQVTVLDLLTQTVMQVNGVLFFILPLKDAPGLFMKVFNISNPQPGRVYETVVDIIPLLQPGSTKPFMLN